ncbi:MAG: transcription elongation factor GreA [Firmicutes bacterium]|uniref:Transcription elongation factor GreA n=1 Tax=Candidatus Alloenteromonas pullistercoris TaxID=2840785 RepID=A0A9D9DG78_9FIRM|nr:transcription elongation factor GreA [Candidatus Enteromonas pullistercoris]
MPNKKIIITQESLDELNEEYRRLNDVEMPDVISKLELARSQGDLSENADYSAARDRQAQVAARIAAIEEILHNHEIAEAGTTDKVSIGHTVTFIRLDDKSKRTVALVGNVGANPTANPPAISNESPIGKAILDKKPGDVATVESPSGDYDIKIESIQM